MPKPNSYTLLMWEAVPESTTLYLIPNSAIPHGEAREALRKAHGEYIGSTENEDAIVALNRVSDALCENPAHLSASNPPGSEWAQRWITFKVDDAAPIENTFVTHVYRCGYMA
jgi:hypothetical protein